MSGRSLARTLRERVPAFATFFGRATDAFDAALFVALVATAATLSMCGALAVRSPLSLLVAIVDAAQIALFVWALAAFVRAVTRHALEAMALPLSATLVLFILAVDRLHVAFFGQHLSRVVLVEALDAIRAKAIPVSYGAVGATILSAILLFVALATLFQALSFLPRPPSFASAAKRGRIPALLVVGILGSFRECSLDPPNAALIPLRRASPWDAVSELPEGVESPTEEHARTAALFGPARIFDEIATARTSLSERTPRVRAHPDVLVVHVESLRADMLQEEVAPHLTAFASECLSAPMHFTTGTNTGTGVFGILNGLTAPFYPLARATHAHPLPLAVLRSLGYGLSVYFISNFGTYDGLYDLYFRDVAGFRYEGPEEPVWDADGKMVDAWIARLRDAPRDVPRFDYVVLDSTHYDYSYPPEFAKFSPAMTLELGARDAVVVQAGINDRMKWRAPFVRNRYRNSIFYVDSLVEKMIDALRETRRIDDTIVLVTGDHGEEFWEHGAFGHGFFGLSNEQTRVPFLLRIPPRFGPVRSRYRYSSHADFFPTIFDVMGLEGMPRFMNGKSLLQYDATLDLALVGFGITESQTDSRYAIVADGLKVFFRDVPPFEVTDVQSDADERIESPPTNRAQDLVVRALANQTLR